MAMSARTITVFSQWLAMKEMDAYRSEITLIVPSPALLALAKAEGLRGICAPLPAAIICWPVRLAGQKIGGHEKN